MGHSAIIAGNEMLYVFGGVALQDRRYLNDLFALDLKKSEWKKIIQKGALPIPCGGHKASLMGDNKNELWLFGGQGLIKGRKESSSSVYLFNISDNTWCKMNPAGSVPSPRSYHSQTVLKNSSQVFIFGGQASEKESLNDVYILSF